MSLQQFPFTEPAHKAAFALAMKTIQSLRVSNIEAICALCHKYATEYGGLDQKEQAETAKAVHSLMAKAEDLARDLCAKSLGPPNAVVQFDLNRIKDIIKDMPGMERAKSEINRQEQEEPTE